MELRWLKKCEEEFRKGYQKGVENAAKVAESRQFHSDYQYDIGTCDRIANEIKKLSKPKEAQMEQLRWLEENGVKRLQYLEGCTHDCQFIDVPTVKAEPKGCGHFIFRNGQIVEFRSPEFVFGEKIARGMNYCLECGAKRPEGRRQ